MRVGPWIVVALLAFGAYRWFATRDIERAPGVLAGDDPVQVDLEGGERIEHHGYKLLPRAEFSATVRVLDREDYSRGPMASLIPTDFAVGWGPMSDSAVLSGIKISQGNRFYYWRTETWPIERREIEIHSANWHVIPENDSVRKVLASLRTGSVVEFQGQLVDVEGPDGGMRTSMKRTDTGAGACEILLVSSARLVESTHE